MRFIFLSIFICFNASAEISAVRQKQLDSITTNIDKGQLRNLDSLHHYLDKIGSTDEELVFLFYGLFATHYTYDMKRAKSTNVKEYTPGYTAYHKSGVCRDFAALFKELCDRSKIPCVIAFGRVKVSFFKGCGEFFSRQLRNANHAWNIVKYNGKWRLMDPTWSTVTKVEKFYGKDKQGRKVYLGKVKIPSRNYYDTPSDLFYKDRRASHPAFYTSSEVFTYKTARKKGVKRFVLNNEYQYSSVLDSLVANPYHQYSKSFTDQTKQYNGRHLLYYFLQREWLFLELKRTTVDRLTVEECQEHLVRLEKLLSFIQTENNIDFSNNYDQHKVKVNKMIVKLKRQTTT